MPDMKEPPALKDSEGLPIVVFRRPDGEFFSNHPDYPMALAIHEQNEALAAKAAAEAPPAPAEVDDDVVEDEPVAEDDGDGSVDYDEMQSKDLVALAKQRKLDVPSGTKRSQVIELLKQDDAKVG